MSTDRRSLVTSLWVSLLLASTATADFGDTLFIALDDTSNCTSGWPCAFGWGTSSAGDMNGDGFNDIIVGNSNNDVGGEDAGQAFVYFTGADMDSIPDIVFTGNSAALFLGCDVSTAGDMNGDGRDDLAIGATGYGSERGRVFIYWGRPDMSGEVSPEDADVKLTGESAITNDWLGYDISRWTT